MLSNAECDVRKQELIDFQKRVKGNPHELDKITYYGFNCGSKIEPSLCEPIDKSTMRDICVDSGRMILKGMKVNGEEGQWSNGFMGSRWFDMDAKKYGCDYIRVAFYSKKFYPGKWSGDKPYRIIITAEKGKKREPESESESESDDEIRCCRGEGCRECMSDDERPAPYVGHDLD